MWSCTARSSALQPPALRGEFVFVFVLFQASRGQQSSRGNLHQHFVCVDEVVYSRVEPSGCVQHCANELNYSCASVSMD